LGSGALIAPVADLLEAFTAGLLEEADAVTDVFEFVNVGPHFSLPMFFMD
jgi:hypothetical protein